MTGVVFDIKEFSVYDGPGVRCTVFLKGCPLRCKWCHNPEGLDPKPQIMLSASCSDCGACKIDGCTVSGGKTALQNADTSLCNGCERCVSKCPENLRRVSGKVYTAEELKAKIMKNRVFLADGGVTFSGGEPTMQADFLCEMLDILPLHRAVQTCGFCSEETFERVLSKTDLMLFDIKHTDSEKHKLYTGVDNAPILRNLDLLIASEKPFIARIPLIAGVNDDHENLGKVAELLKNAKNLIRVELLPYNGAAGAKYTMVGRRYEGASFKAPSRPDTSRFTALGIDCKVM